MCSNIGEIDTGREALREILGRLCAPRCSLLGNQASTATKHDGDSRRCYFEIEGLGH